MDSKQIALLVALCTVVVNVVFALSGITASVSCTVTSAVQHALAAMVQDE